MEPHCSLHLWTSIGQKGLIGVIMGRTGFGTMFFILVSVWYTWAFGLLVTSCMVWSVYSKHCSRLHDGHSVFRLPWQPRRGGSCGGASPVHTERYKCFRLLAKLYSRLVLNKKACAYPLKKPKTTTSTLSSQSHFAWFICSNLFSLLDLILAMTKLFQTNFVIKN